MSNALDGYKLGICLMLLIIVIMAVNLYNSRNKPQQHTAREELLSQYDEALLRTLQYEAQAETAAAAAKVYKARAIRLKEAATAARSTTPPMPPMVRFTRGGMVPGLPASPEPDLPGESRMSPAGLPVAPTPL